MNIGGVALTPELAAFGLLAGLAAASAVGVIAFSNAIRSALCLVANFFLLAFIYFTLNAELLGITQIVVYTGAIMVLFLFVIMLLNLGGMAALGEKPDRIRRPVGILLGIVLFGMVATQLFVPMLGHTKIGAPNDYGAPQAIGRVLFTDYVVPFETVSILLLVGIVGSILLAKRKVTQ